MKALYFDLIAGASGDMILGGLIDAGLNPDNLRKELNRLGLDEFDLEVNKITKNGFQATKVNVLVGKQPPERHLDEILELIQTSDLPAHIQDRSTAIFRKIAEVEGKIHNLPPDQIHLHELGGTDTIVDVTGALLALDQLEISRVFSSPVPLGSGFIQGAHGEIPLPAPATLGLLKGIPLRGTEIQAELVTPTGAALLAALAEEFGPIPEMTLQAVGYGAGSRDLPVPNVLRVLIGNLEEQAVPHRTLTSLECNLDDLNPEIFPYLMEQLFQHGALDVNFIPIQMKKNRPGTQLQVLAEPHRAQKMRAIIFRETTTLGVKQHPVSRYALPRKSVKVDTQFGEIRVKIASGPGGEENISPEFEDCQRVAQETNHSLKHIYREAITAYLERFNK